MRLKRPELCRLRMETLNCRVSQDCFYCLNNMTPCRADLPENESCLECSRRFCIQEES